MQKTEQLATIISKRLQTLRKDDTTPQRTLSEQSDIPLAVLNRALTGTATPSPDALVKLAIFYGVSVDWLLGLSDKKPRKRAR